MDRYFIRYPSLGEMRGEGLWVEIDTKNDQQLKNWAWCKKSHYLPVGRTCAYREVGHGKRPNFVIVGDEIQHQFAGFAVSCPSRNEATMRYAQLQLIDLIKQHTEVGNVQE